MRRQFVLTCAYNASNFELSCNGNRHLHNMALSESRMLILPSDIADFRHRLQESRFIAIVCRLKGMTCINEVDFLTIRTKRKTFHVSTFLSYSILEDFFQILHQEASCKTVFVYRGAALQEFLSNKSQWVPPSVIDAAVLAKQNGVRDTVSGMSEAITNGPFCWRASVFGDTSIPSPDALLHCDLFASVVYEFCMKYGNFGGEDMRHSVAYHDSHPSPSRPRSRNRGDAREGRSKKRKRSSSRSRVRSRSRPRD